MLKLIKQTKIQILVIVVLTVLAYSNSLTNGLVWDDHLFLEQWPDIQSFQGLGNVLKGSAPPSQDKIFRPVRGIIYLFNYSLWGSTPFWYHLQALLIHLATTLLVYGIALITFRNRKSSIVNHKSAAFFAALIFGLHPIHTETINYISASMETWGSLFFFLSFYLYILCHSRPNHVIPAKAGIHTMLYLFGSSIRLASLSLRQSGSRMTLYAVSIIFAFLAFFTYEMTLTLPILIVLYDICFHNLKIKNLKLKILEWLPYFLGVGVFLGVRTSILGLVSRTDYLGYSFYLTQLVMVKVFARYILLLIFPLNQTAIHNLAGDFPSSMIPYDSLEPILNQSIFDWEVLISAALLLSLVVFAIKYIKRYSLVSFCILWLFISLLPVSYIIPHGGAMAEKYLYIASFGFCLLLSYLILRISHPRGAKLILGGFGILVLIYFILTFSRNFVWRDDITLFGDVVKKSPSNLMANYTLGIWFGKSNRLDEAELSYKRAIDKAPNFWEARFNLGNVYLKMGKFDLALDEYQYSLNLNPNLTSAKNLISNIPKIKESTSSATIAGDTVFIPYQSKFNFSLSFPAHWSIREDSKVIIEAPDEQFKVEIQVGSWTPSMSLEDYLKSQTLEFGKLVNQGLAQIPNVDSAFVRVWDPAPDDTGQKLEFFLFKGEKVIHILVYPANSPLMKEFDLILRSIKVE